MRIVHVTATADRAGGAEAYTLGVAAAQRARGDEVWIAHRYGGGGITGGVGELRWQSWRELAVHLDAVRPDVVHVNGSPLDAAAFAELQAWHRVVRSLHDWSFACASGELWLRGGEACGRAHGAGCLPSLVARGCAHRLDLRAPVREYGRIRRTLPLLREAPAVAAHSEFIRSVAVRNGVRADRCHLVRYFAERADAQPPPSTARDVAFVGRIVARKGLDILLLALARRQDDWDVLHVVGDGWDRGRCERLTRRLGLEARVRMHRWLDADGVREVLRAVRVVAVPSRWPEPGAVIAFEAAAAGRAVVASDAGGIPEVVADGVTGLLVPPGDPDRLGDAVASVAADETLAARLGAAAWRGAAAWSLAANVETLDRVYERVAA